MKYRFATILALGSLLPSQIFAQTYHLQNNETVSQLLYDRLNISPIYRGGLLKKVLEYNNLDEEAARSLSVGYEIKVPEGVLTSEIAPEAVTQTPTENPKLAPEPEVTPDLKEASNPSTYTFYAAAKPTIEMMQGKIEPSSFDATLFYPAIDLGLIYESDLYRQIVEGSINYLTIEKDQYQTGGQNFINAGLSYQFLKKIQSFALGVRVQGKNNPLVVTAEDNATYSLKNPFMFFLGPSLQWQKNDYLTEVNLMYAPSQKVNSHNELKNSLGIEASVYKNLNKRSQLGLFGNFSQNNIEDSEFQKTSFGASYRYFFR